MFTVKYLHKSKSNFLEILKQCLPPRNRFKSLTSKERLNRFVIRLFLMIMLNPLERSSISRREFFFLGKRDRKIEESFKSLGCCWLWFPFPTFYILIEMLWMFYEIVSRRRRGKRVWRSEKKIEMERGSNKIGPWHQGLELVKSSSFDSFEFCQFFIELDVKKSYDSVNSN